MTSIRPYPDPALQSYRAIVRRRARDIALVAATVLPLLAACGGGDDDGAATEISATSSSRATATTTLAQPASAARLPLVVDTDLAADDIVALSYLASRTDVDLLAVTVSGSGEVHCPRGVDVARGLLSAMGRGDIPVACGRSTPLSGAREFPEAWRVAADNAYGLQLGLVVTPPGLQQPAAANLLADTIAAAETPVVLLTLGPLTNVADAFAADPNLTSNIARVVVMGGAVSVPGNVHLDGAPEPLAAEWNLYVDPSAAAAVVSSGAPLTLVGLDATNEVPVTEELIERLAANDVTDATARVLHLFGDVFLPPYLWDPLAAIAAVEPSLVPTRPAQIAVVTEGDDAGRTVTAADGAPIDVAGAPDADAIIDHLMRTLAAVPEGEPLATPTTLPVLGAVTVDFDGTTCTYDGPPTLTSGAYEVSIGAGPTEYMAVLAHLLEGSTIDEVLAWVAEHPDEEPPMVDDVQAVGGWGEPSPAPIVFKAGTVAIVCGTAAGAIHVAGTVEVSG